MITVGTHCRTVGMVLSDCQKLLSDYCRTVGLLSEFTVGLSDQGSASQLTFFLERGPETALTTGHFCPGRGPSTYTKSLTRVLRVVRVSVARAHALFGVSLVFLANLFPVPTAEDTGAAVKQVRKIEVHTVSTPLWGIGAQT